MSWSLRSKWTFGFCLMLIGFTLLQMGMYAAHTLLGWEKAAFNVFELCESLIKRYSLLLLGYMMKLAVFGTFVHLLYVTVKQWLGVRAAKRKMTILQHDALSDELNAIYFAGSKAIMVVSHPEPIALTLGFLRPKIILSTGLLNLLDKEELEAVIEHEHFHYRNRDPLMILILQVGATVLWYMPILRWGVEQYKTTRELLADHFALQRQVSEHSLGGALLKLVKYSRGERSARSFVHASFADHTINYRLIRLLNPESQELSMRCPLLALLLSILTFGSLSAMYLSIMI
ncbi:M56 family metallopeptidase [Paenibacillus sp. KS-LC4]|uniref:M56 family metallopeptidase n=1 Tax=Paenibacillus sp. KS-LC4 TaxID=2979727 RepID=UPI0030CCAFE3